MSRPFVLLAALAGVGCFDPATSTSPRPAVDASALDMQPVDAALDRGVDSGPLDAAVDAGPLDAAVDASPLDRGADATPDMAPDATPDAAPDMAADATVDMTPDATPDMAADATPDMAPDLGPLPERACFDGEDNDGDGLVDCADPDCRPEVACFDFPETCDNGVDDNGDGWVDCDDVFCLDAPDACPPMDRPPIDAAAIQARFDAECLDCHSGPQPSALLDLTDFQATTVGVASTQVEGLRIAPGDREASYLWRKMAYTFRTFVGGGGEAMPPTGPLDAAFVDQFGDWIDRQ